MTKLTQTSWLGGQMDVRMTGRQDMAAYRNGASVLKNFVPVRFGSIRKRPGTDFVCDITDWVGENKFRMIPFGFLSGEGFVLVLCPRASEMTDDWPERDRARVYRADGTFVKVEGQILYGIGEDESEIDRIGYVQCNDVLYLAHRKHPPAEIRHEIDGSGYDRFTYETIDFNPVKEKPTIDEIKMTRQFFEDFTFTKEDQKMLDYHFQYYDENTWKEGSQDYHYLEYHKIYDNNKQMSGKTTVNYRASIVIDGSEGPLSDVNSLTFTSPWTDSQVVQVSVHSGFVAGGKRREVRLYKENGGVYGLIGLCGGEERAVRRRMEVELAGISASSLHFLCEVETGGTKTTLSDEEVAGSARAGSYGSYDYKYAKDFDRTVPFGEECAFRVYTYESSPNDKTLREQYNVPVDLVTFTDDYIAPDTGTTPIDDTGESAFSSAKNYPGSVGLYQQRLVWAGTENDPARIWMSRAGDFKELRPHVNLQTDDAIDFLLPITQFANINFIVELGRLFAFAECTELVIGSASTTQGVSYETIMATEHSHLGCTKRLPPIIANNTLLFVNRTGQSVRDYDEQLGSMRFGGTDVSVLSSGIFEDNPIVDWTWQQEPNSTVWCVLKDGRLASFTYDKEQKIAAWAVHELGGGGKALGIAKTCAVFGRDAAHPTTGEVMVAVEREAGSEEGGARRVTLERMRPWGAKNDELVENSLCMDCVRETLQHEIDDDGFSAWASDPGRIPLDEYRLQDGRMAILFYRSEDDGEWIVYVGYTFESVMTTMPPVIGSEGGASQFDVKLGQHAHLRTVGSLGGEIYAVGMSGQASRIDEGAVRDGEDGAEFRDVDVVLAGSNNRDGRVTVRHDDPWPFQLALLELDYEVEG